jgi:hypothetical protein
MMRDVAVPGRNGSVVQQALSARVLAMLADEIQQFDVGPVALAHRGGTQGRRQAFVLHGLQ